MIDKELIERSKKIIKIIGLPYEETIEPNITREYPKILLDENPEMEDEIRIHFEFKKNPNMDIPLRGGITVVADKKTNKLFYVLTKSNMYEVPDELK